MLLEHLQLSNKLKERNNVDTRGDEPTLEHKLNLAIQNYRHAVVDGRMNFSEAASEYLYPIYEELRQTEQRAQSTIQLMRLILIIKRVLFEADKAPLHTMAVMGMFKEILLKLEAQEDDYIELLLDEHRNQYGIAAKQQAIEWYKEQARAFCARKADSYIEQAEIAITQNQFELAQLTLSQIDFLEYLSEEKRQESNLVRTRMLASPANSFKSEVSNVSNIYEKKAPFSFSRNSDKEKNKAILFDWAQVRFFVSYSHHDKEFVNWLVYQLGKYGIRTWVDTINIRPQGDMWSNQVGEALLECNAMIVVLSPESMSSKEVQAEWEYFMAVTQKTIIAVLWKDCVPHYRLFGKQRIDLRDYQLDALQSLIDEIKQAVVQNTLH